MTYMLTEKQAYTAMYNFLETYFKMLDSDVLAMLLGSLSLLPDGDAMDSAMRREWLASVEKALKGEVDIYLKLD